MPGSFNFRRSAESIRVFCKIWKKMEKNRKEKMTIEITFLLTPAKESSGALLREV